MIAKVKLSAVNAFKDSNNKLMDLSIDFERCNNSLNQIKEYLLQQIQICNQKISDLKEAIATLREKIKEIKEEIISIEEEISMLMSSIKDSDEGDGSVSSASLEIIALKAKLFTLHTQLASLKKLEISIQAHILKLEGIVGNLHKYCNICEKEKIELNKVKSQLQTDSNQANLLLQKIESVIQMYLNVKLDIHISNYSNTNSRDVFTYKYDNSINKNNTFDSSVGPKENNESTMVDDNGVEYRKGNDLEKNATFTLNGYTYHTDHEGRTVSASGKLILSNKPRDMERRSIIGKGDEQVDDDRGHLIAHQFNGADSLGNLVAQNKWINQGEYRKLEGMLADKVEEGSTVEVSVIPIYVNGSYRPTGIYYYYVIDGVPSVKLFSNQYKEN